MVERKTSFRSLNVMKIIQLFAGIFGLLVSLVVLFTCIFFSVIIFLGINFLAILFWLFFLPKKQKLFKEENLVG